MKIETGAELLTKQCSLKSKMYASEQTNTITQDVIDEREKCVVKRRKGINELIEKLGTREYVTDEEIEEYLTIRLKEFVEKLTAKGVKKCVKKKKMKMQNYVDILCNPMLEFYKDNVKEQIIFKSLKHEIYTIKQGKATLSWMDDKKYMVDMVNNRSLGHYLNNVSITQGSK